MKKTTGVIALFVGLVVAGASTAGAQTPAPAPESKMFASVNVGAQVRSQTFSSTSTFVVFPGDIEAARVAANQSVGRGFVFDVSGGYRLWQKFSVGVGLWTQNGSGAAAITADLPDPLQFGHPKTVNRTVSDLKQTNVGLNVQVIWTTAITDKIDLAVFGGPSIIHVSQDIGSVVHDQNAAATTISESKTTGKAGNVGVDASYRLTDRYGAGIFVRYAGGEVDLPSAQKVKVGGIQLGIGARIYF